MMNRGRLRAYRRDRDAGRLKTKAAKVKPKRKPRAKGKAKPNADKQIKRSRVGTK